MINPRKKTGKEPIGVSGFDENHGSNEEAFRCDEYRRLAEPR